MIIERCNKRLSKGLNFYPRSKINKIQRDDENKDNYESRIEDETQQARDYDKLSKIKTKKIAVFDSIIEYLNINIPEWNK